MWAEWENRGELPKKRHTDDDEHGEHGDHDDHDEPDDSRQGSARKRQRVRLSCLECRRRKLSCSREMPCDRCIKSGTPERCTYEARQGGPPTTAVSATTSNSFIPADTSFVAFGSESRRLNDNQHVVRPGLDGVALKDAARDHERIRKLELEVTQLRTALGKQSSVDGSTIVASPATTRDTAKDTPPTVPSVWCRSAGIFADADAISRVKAMDNAMCFKSRYCGPHNGWSSLKENYRHFPLYERDGGSMATSPQHSQKDREKRKRDREAKFAQPDHALELLLPSREETDSLVTVYLDQFEQLHRIVHLPTFRKEYSSFWGPTQTRTASFTALVLSMISVSCCLGMQTAGQFIGVKSSAYTMAEKWIGACDTWLKTQSHKHRRLVHYQIECLLYLAKKVNTIKKKRFWVTSGGLVQNAISIGLHQEPDTLLPEMSAYNKEMRRRIWSTIVEFDLQASFDLGVPTLLSQVHIEVDAPRNIDDESFDEDSTDIPMSKPPSEYTFSSYAHFARQSLQTRLELYKFLTGPPIYLGWEQVLQYTDMLTHEIDALPAWDLESDQSAGVSHKPSLTRTLLHIQLRQFLIPLHQPFLKLRKTHSKYQTSEFIYYTAARDLVLMHNQLFQKGIRTLYFLREDSVSAAMNLCNVTLLQPKDSTSLISSNCKETLQLIEKCIALKEDRVLRCGNNDPWGYSSMCAAYGLIETHLGLKSPEDAKSQAAERFVSLHYRLLAYQVSLDGQQKTQPDTVAQQTASAGDEPMPINSYPTNITVPTTQPLGPAPLHRDGLPLSIPWPAVPVDPSQLLVPNPDFNFELLGSDLDDLWGDWNGMDFA